MRAVNSLREVKVGQRISLRYYGGENPGCERKVDVASVSDDRIVGTDIEKQEQRQYLFEKAASIFILSPVNVTLNNANTGVREKRTSLSFADVRGELQDHINSLSGEDLAEVYAEMNGKDKGEFNAESGLVTVVEMVPAPKVNCTFNADGDAVEIDWFNEDGKHVGTCVNMDGTLEVHMNKVSAETFIRTIAEHIGLTIE